MEYRFHLLRQTLKTVFRLWLLIPKPQPLNHTFFFELEDGARTSDCNNFRLYYLTLG